MGFKDGYPKGIRDGSIDGCDFRSLGEFWFSLIPQHLREGLVGEARLDRIHAPVFLNRNCDRIIDTAGSLQSIYNQTFFARGVLPRSAGDIDDVLGTCPLVLEPIPDPNDVLQSSASADESHLSAFVGEAERLDVHLARKGAHGCVFPSELSTRLKERSKDMGDDAGGRGYHQRVLDAVIDEFLGSGGFFPVQYYSQFLDAIIDYCEDGVGVENHFDPFRELRLRSESPSSD